jgi:hypothetical protein
MKRTQIYLKPSQIKNLKEYAERRDISMSEAIRELIDKFFRGKDQKKSVLDEILIVSDKNNPQGPKDLSKKHDKYLYDTND